ncbi:GNAT family N-acetyltransferase [candidate division GN15 bacterium]|nr:GNAT family N-acetyltransferase [candidate division GN15 bacterium]
MIVIETARVTIRRATATPDDIDFYYRLWTTPEVMRNVGFPQGLRVGREDVAKQLSEQLDSVFDRLLLVERRDTGERVGECKLGTPDDEGVASTDVKLLSDYWGNGFGTEIKRALVGYIFRNTDALAIKATPNRDNTASRRMQQAVGGVVFAEGVFRFPPAMRDYTQDVSYVEYRVTREAWQQLQSSR